MKSREIHGNLKKSMEIHEIRWGALLPMPRTRQIPQSGGLRGPRRLRGLCRSRGSHRRRSGFFRKMTGHCGFPGHGFPRISIDSMHFNWFLHNFIKLHWFPIDFYWFVLIFMDLHWFNYSLLIPGQNRNLWMEGLLSNFWAEGLLSNFDPALLGRHLRLFFKTPRKNILGLNRVAVSVLDLKPPGIITKSRSGSNSPPPGPPNPCFVFVFCV